MLKYTSIILCFLILSCAKPVVNDNPCGDYLSYDNFKPLEIATDDGIKLHMNLYKGINNDFRAILFFHQANMNKMEYCSIAPEMQALGYNCIAVDLRSGGEGNGFPNLTNQQALEKGYNVNYLDAYKDMETAMNFVYSKSGSPIILWGSSYTAGLALRLAKENPLKVEKVIAFSPGEYYGGFNLKDAIVGLDKEVFVTSSKEEANSELEVLISAVNQEKLTQFVPKAAGDHGSKALWVSQPSNQEYWQAVKDFLK